LTGSGVPWGGLSIVQDEVLLAVQVSDFEAGRWMPSAGGETSLNFECLRSDDDLRRLACLAENNLHIDPNTTLFKMRQFGELLAQRMAPVFGVPLYPDEEQYRLLERLKTLQNGPEREVLDRLHTLRKLGNEAAHRMESSSQKAAQALRSGHKLAFWFERVIGHRSLTEHPFKIPQDPRRILQQTLDALRDEFVTERVENERRQKEVEAEVEQERNSLLELHARTRASEAEAREEAALYAEIAEEASEKVAELANELSIARKVRAISNDLQRIGLDEPGKAGLPDWTAAIVQGDELPPELGELPEETLEDLQSLKDLVELPRVETPLVVLESVGNLSASSAKRFDIRVALSGDQSGGAVNREVGSGVWRDDNGQEFVLPNELRACLDILAEGPPGISEGQSASDLSRERQLWWGRLRRRLEPFGVRLDHYLNGADAVVVEKLTAHLLEGADGSLELQVSAGDVPASELTPVIDKLRNLGGAPTVRLNNEDGTVRRQRLIFAPAAQKAIVRTQQIRRVGKRASGQLIDAPQTVLGPECFDLSEYSERVVGIGAPVYRVSRAVLIEEPAGGARFKLDQVSGRGFESAEALSLTFSPEEEDELQGLLKQASANHIPYVRFKEGWVRVPSASMVEELDQPDTVSTRRGTLVVEENLDSTGFAARDMGHGYLSQVPDRPPNLAPEFELMPHQKLGFAWLAGHALVDEQASDHGMLADDMGLGKTLQVLSLLSLLKSRDELGPTLIVAPASLTANWVAEADRFFPGQFNRRIVAGGGVRLKAEQLRTFDLVLTSYESLRSQQLEFGRVRWKMMVCDESHRFRNPTAQTTHVIYAMDAERRLALTGTPIQNSLRDLWAQFDWLVPNFLGDLRSFTERYQGTAVRKDPEERKHRITGLRSQIESRVLRRLKEQEIADVLPKKNVPEIRLTLDPHQVALYDQVLLDVREKRVHPLDAMKRLFQVCAAPSVFALPGQPFEPGPKLRWLSQRISEIHQRGERAVVFAEWYVVQDLLASTLSALLNEPVDRINGAVDTGFRLAKIDAFNQGHNGTVMILSPRAAGVGLNITGANHVFHFTRHWNPALEAQATDRVYRIGQTRPVTVYRPVMTHPHLTSIEEHLDQLLKAKEKLAQDILVGIEELSVERELKRLMSSVLPTETELADKEGSHVL
jgi:hypothetical protein